jgi:CheY-like chemotaxis protein
MSDFNSKIQTLSKLVAEVEEALKSQTLSPNAVAELSLLQVSLANLTQQIARSLAKENQKPVAETTRAGLRILVAEDNPVNRQVALRQLKRMGYDAEAVENGKAALEVLKAQKFDLILMDCYMPELDGFETTRAIRSEKDYPNAIPIIAMTASSSSNDVKACMNVGMNDLVAKPMNLELLEKILKKYLKAA